MHILVATDAQYVVTDVTSALSAPDVRFTICTEGRQVSALVAEGDVDLAILDLQIGSKGGMAVCMDLRLDETSGRVPPVPVLMLLDRQADVHLAKRCDADAWLIKPLDPLALKRAVRAATAPAEPGEAAAESAEEEAVAAG